MATELKKWVKIISDHDVSVFKSTMQSIKQISAKDDASAGELSRAILNDAYLTAHILKLANSNYYNPSKTPISTISRAVVVLGFGVVQDLSVSLAVVEGFLKTSSQKHVIELMAKSFHAATQSRSIAEKSGQSKLEEIFIASLLFNLGELLFWSVSDEKVQQALIKKMKEPDNSPEKAQQEVLGFTFRDLTAALLSEWNLSQSLDILATGEKEENSRFKYIALGHELAESAVKGWQTEETEEVVKQIIEVTGLPDLTVREMVFESANNAVEIAKNFGSPEAAKLIPSTSAPEPGPETSPALTPYPEPDPVLQLKILRELSNMLETKPDLNFVLEMLLEGVQRGVGMDRTLFALYSPLERQVKAKYVLGEKSKHLTEKFVFPVSRTPNNLFAQLLFDGQAIWIDGSQKNYSDDLIRTMTTIMATSSFFLAPILISGRPIGLLYADRQPSGRKLDEISFESFKFFGNQASIYIGHISRRNTEK